MDYVKAHLGTNIFKYLRSHGNNTSVATDTWLLWKNDWLP